MEMNIKQIIDMAVATATNNIPTEFSAADVEATLREQLSAFNDVKYLRKNKAVLFEIIEAVADIVVPNKVLEQFSQFADVQRKNYGEKISFTVRTGKFRGKKFVTRAGDKGIYKTFSLDSKDIVMSPRVHAGAARLEIQDFLLGRITMAELMDVLVEALSEVINKEIQAALQASFNAPERPAANKHTAAGFVMDKFDALINTVFAYGDSVTIYAPRAFAQNLYNLPGWAGSANPATALQDYNDYREMGYVGRYKGADVVILKQSFADDANAEELVSNQFAYIMPMGKEKPVKIALEGGTYVREYEDAVGSMEVSIEQMMDVAVIAHNFWAIYQDTSL